MKKNRGRNCPRNTRNTWKQRMELGLGFAEALGFSGARGGKFSRKTGRERPWQDWGGECRAKVAKKAKGAEGWLWFSFVSFVFFARHFFRFSFRSWAREFGAGEFLRGGFAL